MLDIQDSTHAAARYDARILVADDDALARFILADQLDALGCRCVHTAADGAQALQLALSTAYDLVITDLCMPRMGGHALLAALRAHGQSMPVIAGTAWCEQASAFTGNNARELTSRAMPPGQSPSGALPAGGSPPFGFSGVLRKPFAMAQLREVLKAHVGALPLDRRGSRAAGSPRRALYAAFAAAWTEDEMALRAALASLDGPSMLDRLHRLQGSLAVLGEGEAREACARLQRRIRRHGVQPCIERVERFVRQCARIAVERP